MKLRELSFFYNHLHVMHNAGLSLVQIFESFRSTENKLEQKFKLAAITSHVRRGDSLTKALSKTGFVPVFDLPIIEAGEKAGKLGHIFKVLSEHHDQAADAERKIKSGLFLPGFLFVSSLFIPSFPALFLGRITLAEYLIRIFATLAVVGGSAVWIYHLFIKSYYDRNLAKQRHRLFKKLPVLDELSHNIAQEKFCFALEIMLEAGIPIFDALKLAGESSANEDMNLAARRIISEVKSGRSLPRAFETESVFCEDIKASILLGTESGELPGMLRESGVRLRRKVEGSIARFAEIFPMVIYWAVLVYVGLGILGVYVDGFRSLMKLF